MRVFNVDEIQKVDRIEAFLDTLTVSFALASSSSSNCNQSN